MRGDGASTKVKVSGVPALVENPLMVGTALCPGCMMSTVSRIIAEVLDEFDAGGRTVGINGVGCHAGSISGFNIDRIAAAHGRAPDIATAVKRIYPDRVVFTIQGDGDCIAIGADSLVGALTRGEKFTIVMCNNTNYGTTGGQLGPTTLVGQKTPTTPHGRNPKVEGFPVHAAELVATFNGVAYSARGSLHNPAHYQKTKKYMRTAFQKQVDNAGLSFVEVIVGCPTNWHMTPVKSLSWIEENVIPEFPLGEFKNV